MESLSGRKAAAVLDVAAGDVESGADVEGVKRFAAGLLEYPSSQYLDARTRCIMSLERNAQQLAGDEERDGAYRDDCH